MSAREETKLNLSCGIWGQSFSVCYTSQLKREKTVKKNLPTFQVVQPDRVRVESSSCCFPREW